MFSEAMTVLKHSQIEQTNKTPDLRLLRKNLFNSANDNIKVEGVGFGAKQDVATIHSEFGALVAEQFKDRDTPYYKRFIISNSQRA